MKQGKITSAFNTLTKMYRTKGLPFGISSILFNMKRQLEPYRDHQAEQEELLAEKYSGGEMDENGGYKMDGVARTLFAKDLIAMQNTEVECDVKPVTIDLNDELCEKMGITGETIDMLEGFIEFKMGDDGK